MNIVGMIPARLGSTRVKNKKLRYLGNKPLVQHVIEVAKKSKLLDQIYLNSESEIMRDISNDMNISFYKRNKKFSTNKAANDVFALDFFNHTDADIMKLVHMIFKK